MVQWVRFYLPTQETRVSLPLSGNIPHAMKQPSPSVTTTEPLLQSPGAPTTEARALEPVRQQEKPPEREACSPQLEKSAAMEALAQPKITKSYFKTCYILQ